MRKQKLLILITPSVFKLDVRKERFFYMTTPRLLHDQPQKKDPRPHVVIIGAGFGGLQAAKGLAHAPVRVTVIDRTNHHLFQPLLYQVATASLSPADICATTRHVLKHQKNATVLLAEVTGIDVENKLVLLGEQAVSYDYLIVATGAKENYFGHQDEWKPFAPGLKTIDDARELRRKVLTAFEEAELESDPRRIEELLTFVIVGGGPTGVEMAGAIAEMAHKTLNDEFEHIDPHNAHILLIEALPRILGPFSEKLARLAHRELVRKGVDVRVNSPLESIDGKGVVVAGERIDAATILWTAGVLASPAGQWLGAEVDRAGRVKVQDDLSIPGHSEIYVVGDTAAVMQDGKPVPGVAPAAMQMGRYVAAAISAHTQGQEHGPSFHYVNKGSLATVGRNYAIVDLGKIQFSGFIAWVFWLFVHIVYLIGFYNRFAVMLQWAASYLTFHRRARIITRKASSSVTVEKPTHLREKAPEGQKASRVS
jgi:NADH:ubiquinone reductase (H+-translocating)